MTTQQNSATNRVAGFSVKTHLDASEFLNLVIYGPSGSGKTYLAGTAADVPEMRDILYLDTESGTTTIRDRINSGQIDLVSIQSWTTLRRVYMWLSLHLAAQRKRDDDTLRELQQAIGLPMDYLRRYRTVVIDSLDEAQKQTMYQLIGVNMVSTSFDQIFVQPQFKEWGQNAEMIRLMMRQFRDLPIHTIFCCKETIDDKDPDNPILPNLPGKLAKEIPAFVDFMGYLVVGEVPIDIEKKTTRRVHRLYINPTRNIRAKNRFGDDRPYIDNPTIGGILGDYRTHVAKNTGHTNEGI